MTDPLALAAMVAWCGWDPTEAVTDRQITLDGNGTSLITLPSLYVTDVSQVVITDEWGTVATLASTDTPPTIGPGRTSLSWSQDGCLIYKGCQFGRVFPADQQNVVVTYSGGYTYVPEDLQAALDSLGKRSSSLNLKAKTMGKTSFTYVADSLLLVEQLVFNRYRIMGAR